MDRQACLSTSKPYLPLQLGDLSSTYLDSWCLAWSAYKSSIETLDFLCLPLLPIGTQIKFSRSHHNGGLRPFWCFCCYPRRSSESVQISVNSCNTYYLDVLN